MKCFLVVLLTLLVSFSSGPLLAIAQEATPGAAEPLTGADLARTDTRYFVPFSPDGVNPGLDVRSTTEGTCTFSSTLAHSRPDAWTCLSADNEIFDPCFENPLAAADGPGEVVCFDSPFGSEVVVMTLTSPLLREKEAPTGAEPGAPAVGSADAMISPWDLPWALELANGDRCSLLRGTLTFVAGQVVHYGCENQGLILGETDRRQPVWVVSYVPAGSFTSSLVEVVAAYT